MHEHSTAINHDQSEPNAKAIGWLIILSFLVILFFIGIGMLIYKGMVATEELEKESVSAPAELVQQLASEQKTLEGYKWLDVSKNNVLLPISKGMDKVIERYRANSL